MSSVALMHARLAMPGLGEAAYEKPALSALDDVVFEENEVPVFIAAIGWVLLVFGSAWAYCKAVCGWRGVRSCETSWLRVKAVCRG